MKPILQALLLCDHVYRDVSGKFIIVGVFDRWYFKLPQKKQGEAGREEQVEAGAEVKKSLWEIQDVGTPWAYMSLTDVKGPRNWSCDLKDLVVLKFSSLQ
jgi:hypothetical protein